MYQKEISSSPKPTTTNPITAPLRKATRSPLFLFLDLELGEENGFDIAEQIVLMNNDAIIIFVTSHENLEMCIRDRVMMSGKVKDLRSGAEAKASVKSTKESLIIDPKPGDLSMSRLKLP